MTACTSRGSAERAQSHPVTAENSCGPTPPAAPLGPQRPVLTAQQTGPARGSHPHERGPRPPEGELYGHVVTHATRELTAQATLGYTGTWRLWGPQPRTFTVSQGVC